MSAQAEVAPGILALDALAGQLQLRAGVRIGVAHTIVELGAVHRLRHRHVSTAPEPLEPDPYDDHALQLAAWRGSALVATMRLVLPVPGRRLPTEEAFDLDIEPRGGVVDVGDLIVGPAAQGDSSHRAWGGLFALAWQEARARSYTVMAGIASEQLVERYRSLGVRVEVLGQADAELHPVRLDPAAGKAPDWF
jgi:hypothetical protein